jgi:hypothetical protein
VEMRRAVGAAGQIGGLRRHLHLERSRRKGRALSSFVADSVCGAEADAIWNCGYRWGPREIELVSSREAAMSGKEFLDGDAGGDSETRVGIIPLRPKLSRWRR